MSKRLPGYDYSQPGFYFITICTLQHRLVFGSIVDDQMFLRGPGHIAQSVLVTLPRRFTHVKLDADVFMPNHMHAIIELTDKGATTDTTRVALWEIIRVIKGGNNIPGTAFRREAVVRMARGVLRHYHSHRNWITTNSPVHPR